MVELIVIAVLAFCAFVVIGSMVAAASIAGWILTLPFRILGLLFRGLGLLIGLPFVLLGGVIGLAVFGVGALVVLLPLLPLALLAFAVVWLVRHSNRHAVTS